MGLYFTFAVFVIVILVAVSGLVAKIRKLQLKSAYIERRCAELENLLSAQNKTDQFKLESILQSLDDGILVVNTNGQVSWFNKSVPEITNLSSIETGKTLIQLFLRHEIDDLFKNVISNRAPAELEIEFGINQKKYCRVRAFPIFGNTQSGQVTAVVIVLSDLTEIKRLEKIRQEFVANVSHELRTPISLIKGAIETVLYSDMSDEATQKRFLRMIEKHVLRLETLVNDILSLSQLESGKEILNIQKVNLFDLANKGIEELSPNANRRNIRISNRIPQSLFVNADPDKIHQVFVNLIDNAIKYGIENGKIDVYVDESSGDYVDVHVKDDGPGIPFEAQHRIFERFFRLDKARSRDCGGTGLGLSIVKHIIQAHGGKVNVVSEPGKGADFSFTLKRYISA